MLLKINYHVLLIVAEAKGVKELKTFDGKYNVYNYFLYFCRQNGEDITRR